jgi:hypothetical protein
MKKVITILALIAFILLLNLPCNSQQNNNQLNKSKLK